MAWVVSVTLDVDKPDVGSVVSTFTDVDSSVFTYSDRVFATANNRDAYIAAAIAARNAWRTKKTAEAGFNTNIQNRFVTLDV